jgi:hypothetical protein
MHSVAYELARDKILPFATSKKLSAILRELASIQNDIEVANTLEEKQARRAKREAQEWWQTH